MNDIYKQALECIAKWPSVSYDEEVREELGVFARFVMAKAETDTQLVDDALLMCQDAMNIDHDNTRKIGKAMHELMQFCIDSMGGLR